MLRRLDWQTPCGQVNLSRHWRIVLCLVGGGVISTAAWHALFPHTFPPLKLWTGFTTGMTVAMIPGTLWQLRAEERWATTSGRLIALGVLTWGLFAGISVLLIAPDLAAQETERSMIRSMEEFEIAAIRIQIAGQEPHRLTDVATIEAWVRLARRAELFSPSHEGSVREFEITLERRVGGPLHYRGRVPERHTGDVSLAFRGPITWSELLIPGGRAWLDSVAQ